MTQKLDSIVSNPIDDRTCDYCLSQIGKNVKDLENSPPFEECENLKNSEEFEGCRCFYTPSITGANEMPEEKKDYLKIASQVFDAGTSYTSEQDKERSQNAQAAALIAIAEELRRLNENFENWLQHYPH